MTAQSIVSADGESLLCRLEAGERLSIEEWKLIEDFAPTEELGRLADALRTLENYNRVKLAPWIEHERHHT